MDCGYRVQYSQLTITWIYPVKMKAGVNNYVPYEIMDVITYPDPYPK